MYIECFETVTSLFYGENKTNYAAESFLEVIQSHVLHTRESIYICYGTYTPEYMKNIRHGTGCECKLFFVQIKNFTVFF